MTFKPPELPLWLSRYLREIAHEIAVKTTVGIALMLFAALTQLHFDWIGKSRNAIGEWRTTVKKGH